MRVLITIPAPGPSPGALDTTLDSIFTQAGDFHLRCHIRDGSPDGAAIAAGLAAWADRLTGRTLPILSLTRRLDGAAAPGAGLGQLLCEGFAALGGGEDEMLTWLEPGDMLAPGALATATALRRRFGRYEVGWFGGASAPLPAAALAAGLGDGHHWDRLAQPGVFFRRAWWQAIDPEATVAPLGAAAGWQVWRLLAQKLAFTQWPEPLGQADAAAAAARQVAEATESAALLPPGARRAALLEMARAAPPRWRRLGPAGAGDDPERPVVTEHGAAEALARHAARVLGAEAPDTLPAAPPKTVWQARDLPPPPEAPITQQGGILALDAHWQYPAITERQAFRQMQRLGDLPPRITYVAFPWATLLDKLMGGAPDADRHLRLCRDLCARIPAGHTAITVCQHIHLKRHLPLFREAGIGHVFWSHATRNDHAPDHPAPGQVALHPFPLYPVQVAQALPDAVDRPRPLLFSFLGARANQHYLTSVRRLILDRLVNHPAGVVEGRDGWHYRAIVYDHQVHGRALPPDAPPPETPEPDRFRALLADSVFALCPSGTGPNSIRLWEALGAGAIPVILADTWAPPGDPALWQAAALFVPETEPAVAELPAQLAALATDPARLAAMRRAGRQLWLLYGPDSFVTDIRLLLARLTPAPDLPRAPAAPDALLPAGLAGADLLGHAASLLLLGRASPAALTTADAPDPARIARARADLAPDHPTGRLFARALALAAAAAPAAPMIAPGRVPVLCLLGPHANRTPLAYAPFRRDLGPRLAFTDDPGRADLVMTGYTADLAQIARMLAPLPPARRPKIAVLSEEPLWDSIWSGGFETRERSFHAEGEDWRFAFLNHHTSAVFAFDRLPSFLLTRDDLPVRLALWMLRRADLSPADLVAAWEQAPVPAAFVAERRDDSRYDAAFPTAGVRGLSVWRSRLAEAVTRPGTLRLGQGWPDPGGTTPPRRQDLPDWHLDKAARLDGRVVLLSAVENTHQNAYVSEKPFDAFALGAVPITHAGPDHRLHGLVPGEAMLNTWGLTPAEAAARVMDFRPDRSLAAAWGQTARALAQRLADPAVVRAERERAIRTILAEVATLV